MTTLIRLDCGCQPTVSRCRVARELWTRVEERRAAGHGVAVALADYKGHMDAGWAARDAQRAAAGA